MILVDQMAEVKLVERLEALRTEPTTTRALRLMLGDAMNSSLREMITIAVRATITSDDTQVYFIDEGNVFLFTTPFDAREVRACVLSLVDHLKRPAGEDWVQFLEFPLHINPMLVLLEGILEKQHAAEEAARHREQRLAAERRRAAILEMQSLPSVSDIGALRAARSEVALMIIEDDMFTRRLVETTLQKKYTLTGLGEATHALETYARVAPDLLFLDINLPDVTGHELLERIIALDPEAYVIMLSGNADKENVTQAIAKGAKGFIAKPFTRDKLVQYIDRCPSIAHKLSLLAAQ